MARTIALRTVMVDGLTGDNQEFVYGDMMLEILKRGPAGRGLTLDEILRAVEAIEPIEAAVAEGAVEVVLSDSQWQTLLEKLNSFYFGFAHKRIGEFGLSIRNATEIGAAAPEARAKPKAAA
jgi:hypothetical protein